MRGLIEIVGQRPGESEERVVEYEEEVKQRKEAIDRVAQIAREYADKKNADIKRRYDAARAEIDFEAGSYVLKVADEARRSKLSSRWDGPYGVEGKVGEVIYELRDLVGKVRFKAHVKKLKQFEPGGLTETQMANSSLPGGVWVVEDCVGYRQKKNGLLLEIKWKGYPETT